MNLPFVPHQSYSMHVATFCLAITASMFMSCHSAQAQTVVFREDFEDTDVPANILFEPPECRTQSSEGIREIRDGSLFMRGEALSHINTRITGLGAPRSIEARARLSSLPSDNGMFILAGLTDPCGEAIYWAGTFRDGRPGAGAGNATQVFPDFNQGNESLVNLVDWFQIRVDFDSEKMSLWVWDSDGSPNELPDITYPVERFDLSELTDVIIEWNAPNTGNQPWLEVDYIQVSTVPEPSGFILAFGISALAGLRRNRRSTGA